MTLKSSWGLDFPGFPQPLWGRAVTVVTEMGATVEDGITVRVELLSSLLRSL